MVEAYKNNIWEFYKSRKRMPSYAELAELCGFSSTNAAFKVARKLIDSGFIGKDSAGKLIPGRRFREVPLLGAVEAGFPSPAEEELCDTMSLDEFLIDNPQATYMLEVKGDSMVDAGICEGDLVIVERTENYNVGDIVIAEIDGEWTIKYLRKRGNQFYLEPANKAYQAIVPKHDLKVAAVVKAVVRKY